MKRKQHIDNRLKDVVYSNLIRFSIIITLPVMLMFFGLYGFVAYHHYKQATYFVDYSVQNLRVECDNILRQAEIQGIKLATNEALVAFVASNGAEHTTYKAQEFLSAYQGLNSFYDSVKLYSISGKNYVDAFRYDFAKNKELEELSVPMHKLEGRNVLLLPMAKNNKYPYLVRLMFPMEIGTSIGAVVIDINAEKFGAYTHNLGKDAIFNFVDYKGKIVFGSDIKHQFNKNFIDVVGQEGRYVHYTGKKYVMQQRESDYYPFTYTSLVPPEYFFPSKIILGLFFLLGIIISMGSAFFVALSITKRSVSPFDVLIKMLETPAEWEKTEDLPPEIRCISEVLHEKFQKKSDIEKEMAGRLLLLKAAELQTMQMQMNPHFLYNILDILSWEIYGHLGRENTLSKKLTELSDMYRMCLNKKGYIVMLDWELSYVRTYFNLVQYIEDKKVTLDINVDEKLLHQNVVKFMLQPLVENAINHGIKDNKSIGIYISAELVDTVDIAEELSEMIIPDVENREFYEVINVKVKGSGLALKNINRRIRMLMGEQDGLSLSKSPYGGLRVTVTLSGGVCEI